MQKPKTIQNRDLFQLNCFCDQSSVNFSVKFLKMKLKLDAD